MSLSEVVRITHAAWEKMDYGARNTYKIELNAKGEIVDPTGQCGKFVAKLTNRN